MDWFFLLLAGTLIQQPSTIDEVLRVDVVVLDVLVTDEHGTSIGDLTVNDFTIFENRRKVTPNYFEAIRFDHSPQKMATDADPLMQTMVLLMDFSRMNIPNTKSALTEIRAFLSQQPKQFPFQVLIYSFETGMVTKGFSRDKVAILDDFTQFEIGFLDRREKYPNYHEQFSLVALERELQTCMPKMSNAPSAWRSNGANIMGQNCIRAAFDQYARKQNNQTQNLLNGLDTVLNALARIEGLKSVYLVGPGISIEPGKSGSFLATRFFQNINRSQNSSLLGRTSANIAPGVPVGGNSTEDLNTLLNNRAPKATNFSTFHLGTELQNLAHKALSTRTVVHTFGLSHNYQLDRRGSNVNSSGELKTQWDSSYVNFSEELQSGMAEISQMTGGMNHRPKDLGQALTNTLETTKTYYVLGYPKKRHQKKGFHTIRVVCKKDNARVHHQQGFFRSKRQR